MQCLYCGQRLNFLKSLVRSSFCSPEHQKLYEEAESHSAFERLLEFAKKDSELTAGPAEPGGQQAKPVPSTAPEPQAVAEEDERADKAAEPAPEPPVGGFLLEPMVCPAVSASYRMNADFENLEWGFPPEPPALPSLRIEVAATDLQKPASEPVEEKPEFSPDVPKSDSVASLSPAEQPASALLGAGQADEWPPSPRASWSHHSLAAVDAPELFTEVPGVGPIRPRAIALEMPSPETRRSEVRVPSLLFSSDTLGFQLAVQAVIDTCDLANLARLDLLHREAQTANAKAQWSSPKPGVPALSQPDAVGLSFVPQPKLGLDASDASFTVGMLGAVTRTTVGSNVSPAAPPPQPAGTLGLSAVPCPILTGVQNAPGPGQPTIFPVRLEQQECQSPAMHWRARPPGGAGLPRRAFANLKLDQDDGPTAVPMNRAVTPADVARAARRPQAPASRFVSTLGSSGILNPVFAAVQNAPGPPVYTIYSASPAHWQCVMPAESTAPRTPAVKAPVIGPGNLTIRASDTAAAVGIRDVAKPPAAAIPPCILDMPAYRGSVTIVINRVARKVLAQVQDKDSSQRCAISPALPARRGCLLPAILWSSETGLTSAIASVGRFHESDCAGQVFPSEAPVTRVFSIRFARESLQMDAPAIAFDRTTRRLALEVCEWKAGLEEAQRLAQFRASGTSPLSLVALPEVWVKRLAVRFSANFNQFTSITNPAKRGVAPSAAASTDERKPAMTLPQSAGLGLSPAFHLSFQTALKSPLIEPADLKFAGAVLRPHPSPVRAQPASLLVLPVSIPVWSTR